MCRPSSLHSTGKQGAAQRAPSSSGRLQKGDFGHKGRRAGSSPLIVKNAVGISCASLLRHCLGKEMQPHKSECQAWPADNNGRDTATSPEGDMQSGSSVAAIPLFSPNREAGRDKTAVIDLCYHLVFNITGVDIKGAGALMWTAQSSPGDTERGRWLTDGRRVLSSKRTE